MSVAFRVLGLTFRECKGAYARAGAARIQARREGSDDEHVVEAVTVKVYKPTKKPLADCFKYRNQIGLDVALEALRDSRQKYRGKME